ncbi:MAG: GreA/GreB family elongation factor [Polyangiaceae bacterium]|nr:GreA/GreB family elongation factor [Polyangiaceae bacterium]
MTLKRIVLLRRDSERLGALLSGRANAENAVIRLLDDKLSRADLVESLDEAAHIVTMDSIVAVRRPSQSRPRVLRLVYPDEAVPEGGRISVLSPLGACVLGHPEGEVCDSGGMPLLEAMVVESVTRMPESRAGGLGY